jgi:glycosyltransferase involved in cell wall biosynthesis
MITFSIITPTWNSELYLAETIESVISQKGDFAIEYIIADNASTDSTLHIANKYKALIDKELYPVHCVSVSLKIITGRDAGMYDALNKGFNAANGDIFAWINSDDLYLPGAFDIVSRTFRKYAGVLWLKGITSRINADSVLYKAGKCNLYDTEWLRKGVYGRDLYFVQQDSVFFRASLWATSGKFDPGLKLAGDYALWVSFSHNADFYSLNAYVSCFRTTEHQLSKNMEKYNEEVLRVGPPRDLTCKLLSLYSRFENRIPGFVRPFVFRSLFGKRKFNIVDMDNNSEPNLISTGYYKAPGN